MSDIAIKVENLSKLYQLGQIGTGTLSRDLNRWWASIRGKEDPYARIGQINDRTRKAETDFVWALRDINFEVRKGEVLGIIGRNGAGKSTLLKVLSKITKPTTGRIFTNGRIASLLEVGTGFHPEMTGRENIYMNGAILGMRKSEIQMRFDEIVSFSGVEAYIDTPVKRYSSGMYVRLAFGVAAFLEPEILIIDEVLAVGDADFQKKCLGRMQDISKEDGRTILFVSHNLVSIQSLCTKGLILAKGGVNYLSEVADALRFYSTNQNLTLEKYFSNQEIKKQAKIFTEKLFIDKGDKTFNINEEVILKIYNSVVEENMYSLDIQLFHSAGFMIYNSCTKLMHFKNGKYLTEVNLNQSLNSGVYYINFAVLDNSLRPLYKFVEVLQFEIIDNIESRNIEFYGHWSGLIRPDLKWAISHVSG